MNKEKLEKMFNEKVTSTRIYDEYRNEITDELFNFIFNEIIPEVLKDILNVETSRNYWNDYISYWRIDIKWKVVLENIKQKAKELYWITL